MTAASTAPPVHVVPHTRSLARVARWGVLVAVLGAASAFGYRIATAHPRASLQYQSVRVDHGPLAAKVTATGTLSALVTVSVGSQVSGRIDTLGADFESQVTKGQVVATIEPSLFRAAVSQARANYLAALAAVDKAQAQSTLAARQLARAKRLQLEGLMSQADLDTAQAAYDAAVADAGASRANVGQSKAALDQAELNLRYTTIISPIDGVVISRNVDIGQTVAAALQAPVLFTIAQDLTRMQVDTNVAEADVGKIRAMMPVTFTVDAYPGRRFDGVVRQVRDNAQTIQNVVTYDAVIDVDNQERVLKPGMTASVTFVYADKSDVVRVPTAALRFKPDSQLLGLMGATAPKAQLRADQRVVWLLRSEHPTAVIGDVGISDGTSSEIVKGEIHDGDVVVIEASPESKR